MKERIKTMKNKKRFAQIMAAMGIALQKEVDKALIRIYWEIFRKYSDEQIEAACNAALTSCKFFPKPSEIIELIPNGSSTPLAAWGAVMDALEHGTEAADPGINETVRRLGGWGYLREKTNDELQWISKRFVEHYRDLQERTSLPALGAPERVQHLIEQATSKKV